MSIDNKNNPFNEDSLFEQMTNISKAHGYDILADQVEELKEKNERLKERVQYFENLIKEYITKMKELLTK